MSGPFSIQGQVRRDFLFAQEGGEERPKNYALSFDEFFLLRLKVIEIVAFLLGKTIWSQIIRYWCSEYKKKKIFSQGQVWRDFLLAQEGEEERPKNCALSFDEFFLLGWVIEIVAFLLGKTIWSQIIRYWSSEYKKKKSLSKARFEGIFLFAQEGGEERPKNYALSFDEFFLLRWVIEILAFLKFIYSEKATKLCKISTLLWLALHRTKIR